MPRLSLNDLINKVDQQTLNAPYRGHGGHSARSFGVVNSKANGRRLSFSKKLCEDLKLEDSVEISPVIDENIVLIGKNLPVDERKKFSCTLKGEDSRKISYAGGLVQDLTVWFNLDYSNCTSKSFTDMYIMDAGNGTDMAVVTLKQL